MSKLQERYRPWSNLGPYGPVARDDRFSIQQQPNITHTLGAIEKDNANLEAERGELALKPDLSGIYKIGGKTHARGGTPLNLDNGSFIFSNDKNLHINPYEKETFEFKEGGTTGKKANTPARVLSREIDVKHYNHTANVLNDKSETGYDTIAKNSAALMLQKYQEKIGQVAFVQEAKKGFPTGIPDFSHNTAPMYNNQTKEQIEQNPQYMQFGGFKGGTGIGGGASSAWAIDSTKYAGFGAVPPIKKKNPYIFDVFPDVNDYFKHKYPQEAPPYNAPKSYQFDKFPDMNDWFTKQNPQTDPTDPSVIPDPMLDHSHIPMSGNPRVGVSSPSNAYIPTRSLTASIPQIINPYQVGQITAPPIKDNNPLNASKFNPSSSLPYDPQVPLSPLQKANLLYSAYNALTVPRYSPQRMNIQSPLLELEKYNPQAQLNSIDNSVSQAYAANRVSNPYLANASNAAIFGKSLDAKNQIQAQADNQNVGIANQQNTANNQIQAADLRFNIGANNQYYNQTQALNQNYNDETRAARNQTVSLYNDYQSKNQELEQFLGSQRNAGKVQVGTNADGSPIYRSMPLYGFDNTGFRPRVYYTGAGSLDSLPGQSNKASDLQSIIQQLQGAGISANSPAGSRIIASALGKGNYASQYQTQKKGGKVFKNPYID